MTEKEYRYSVWPATLSTLLVFIATTVGMGKLLRGNEGNDPDVLPFIVYCSGFFSAILFALLVSRRWRYRLPSFRMEKWKFAPRQTVAGVILMLAASFVLSPLTETIPEAYFDRLNQYMQGGFWPMLTTVIAAPILEEFLFRGIIQKNITLRYGPLAGIIIGAVLFGVIHLVPQQIVYATAMGLILGTIYHLTGSLNSVIAIHFVNNGLTALLYMFFGTSVGLEHKIFPTTGGWTIAYVVSLSLLAIGTLRAVQIIRRQTARKEAPSE